MIPTCLTLSYIRYMSRVKWSNPGKGVAPSPTVRSSSYWKGSLLVTLDYGHQLYFYLLKASLSSVFLLLDWLPNKNLVYSTILPIADWRGVRRDRFIPLPRALTQSKMQLFWDLNLGFLIPFPRMITVMLTGYHL